MAIDLNRSRRKLPVAMVDRSSYSMFSVIKQAIGKDLTRFSIPVCWNEPLSFVQRLAESLEHSFLLDRAADTESSIERLHFITAYVVSNLSTHLERGSKPFNPLLGETFEVKSESDQYFHYIAEQVSHHPPISAFYARGRRWELTVHIEPILKLQGTNVVSASNDLWKLRIFKQSNLSRQSSQSSFHSCDENSEKNHSTNSKTQQELDDEEYTWRSPDVTIHNILFGSIWCEFQGQIDIRHTQSEYHSILKIKQSSWFASAATRALELFKYDGFIYDGNQQVAGFHGDISHCYYAIDNLSDFDVKTSKTCSSGGHRCVKLASNDLSHFPECTLTLTESSRLIWFREIPLMNDEELRNRHKYYFFSPFSLALNECNVDNDLPPTDSRFRMDIRYLEEGKLDESSNEKHRLEEKQRAEARERQTEYKPLWFKKTETGDYEFTGEYFQRNFEACPKLFLNSHASDQSETVQ